MDIPSLFMIPSAVSSGKVHSVFPNSTDADFDFNRDSDATRVNSEGLIERVGYYGSELVTNGGFDTDSNWVYFSQWNISNNKANFLDTSGGVIYQNGVTLTSGKTYKLKFTISDSLGNASLLFANSSGTVVYYGSDYASYTDGSYTLYITMSSSQTTFAVYGNTSGNSFSIDNVSVVEVLGDRARLNYEIEGGLVNTKPSLLLEPQSTNLITYSEDLSQWTLQNAGTGINPVVTVDNAISPDGTRNADRIVFNSGSGTTSGDSSQITNIVSISSGTDATASIYLKGENGGEEIVFRGVADGTYTKLTLTKEWQRFSTTENSGTNTDAITFGIRQNVSGLGTINSSATVYAWGGQIETSTYATSYIPTNGSTQTRAAETCNGAGTSSIFESSEGILYVETKTPDSSAVPVISLSDGTFSNEVEFAYYGTNQWNFVVRAGGSSNFVSGTTSENTFSKFAISYTSSSYKVYKDGVLIGSQTMASALSGLSVLDFSYPDNTNHFKGNVRDIRVYNTKEMTDSEVDILLTKITS